MSLIKKDKRILDLFKKEKIKSDGSAKSILIKNKFETYEEPKENSTTIGLLIYIGFCLIIMFGGAYFISPYLSPEQVLAYKMIVGCISVIMWEIFQFGNSLVDEDSDEEDYEEEEEKDDEE